MTVILEPNDAAEPNGAPWGTYSPSTFVERVRRFAAGRGRGYLGTRAAFAARKLALARLNGPVDIEVFGHKVRVDPSANLAEKRVLFTPQYFDPKERDLLRRALPADAIFIDIGANVGMYSFFAAQVTGPTARIIAVEPQPAVYQRLVHNIAFNPNVPIEAVPIALADTEGDIQLFVGHTNMGETSMRRIGASSYPGATLTVMAKPLIKLVGERDLPRIDALKIDIEGAEDLVLAPYFCDAPRELWPSLMIIENSPESWQTDCIALAHEKGYSTLARTRLNIVLSRPVAQ